MNNETTSYGSLNYSIIVEMKNWLLDCCYDDDDVQYVEDSTKYDICDLVDRFYEGGIEGFLASIYQR